MTLGDGMTVSHPCFNTTGMSMLAETLDDERSRRIETSLKVRRYLTPDRVLGPGAPGEPEPHYYFERSLSDLLGAGFRAGLVLDGMEEPAFEPSVSESLSWRSIPEFPPIFAAKFRVA